MDPVVAAHLPALAWLLAASALVFFMQAGFAAVEAGAVRYKNSINVALKNVIDLCCSFAAFFVVGFAIMFGANWDAFGLIGTPRLFLDGVPAVDPKGVDVYTVFPLGMFLFQVTFCSTAATIVSGGVAERCRFMAYVLVSFGIGAVLYPIYGHWAWGGGWLQSLGFHDFAGSSVVHILGAGITLAGLIILGPRAGRFAADGTPQRIPSSSMPMMCLGVFILAFGWIGFNGGSAPLGGDTPKIIINTLNAGCFGGLAVLLLIWAMRGVPEADLILNGLLGGLVAITASANCVSLPASAVIGIIGGVAVVIGTRLLERWRLDDAVGAVPVHGFAGVAGILCTAIFVDPSWLAANKTFGQAHFLGIQVLGAAACLAFAFISGLLLWWLVGRFTSLRICPNEEAVGMNYSEHKVDDPVAGLAAAAEAAAAGRPVRLDLDDVRDGDLLPLARSVKTLVERQTRLRANGDQWAEALAAARAAVQEHAHHAGTAAVGTRAELADARRSLDKVLTYLQAVEHRDPFVPVLLELVGELAKRIDLASDTLPRVERARDDLRTAAGRMEDLGESIRAGRGVTQ
jgi:Amt family ammonium transporter